MWLGKCANVGYKQILVLSQVCISYPIQSLKQCMPFFILKYKSRWRHTVFDTAFNLHSFASPRQCCLLSNCTLHLVMLKAAQLNPHYRSVTLNPMYVLSTFFAFGKKNQKNLELHSLFCYWPDKQKPKVESWFFRELIWALWYCT